VKRWLTLLLTLACACTAVQAADLPSRGKPFRIDAADKPLPDLLREIAAAQGITAVVDPKVSGTVSGRFALSGNPGSVQMLLNSLCSANGLTWYYDGAFLFVDPASEARSEVLAIAPGNAARISETLARLRIADPRYTLSVSERDGHVHVSGPKRYVEMVKQTVRLIDQRSARVDAAEVRMFPLRYAWAADFRLARNGKEVAIPGVASVLRNLYGKSGGSAAAGSSGGAASVRNRLPPMSIGPSRQIQLSSGESVNAPKIDLGGMAASSGAMEDDGSGGGSPAFSGGELPQFQADTRMNAVLVRDIPERMARYEKLITSMDSRPRLVEIEVTIMDISTDTLDSLGVDWRLRGDHFDLQTGRGNNPPLTWGQANSEAGQSVTVNTNGLATTPLGALFTASIGNDVRRYLLTRVHALAQKGNANFVARPKVLTLDNNEAVLENFSEFYVRVDGFQDAGLFRVTAGTAVRVTPLIIDEQNGRGVMMSIDIQDGDLSSASVDRIPIVRRRTVNTQALVAEGTSLLIAGYTSEEKTNATSGVPVLSAIPVLGKLFQYSEKKQLNMERFYLLTPRLVVPGGAQAAPALPAAPAAPADAPPQG
jgi:type III secretion protein C